ncbi:molybdopterin-dependent oxidoreductase [Luteipulveratus sp. YIM 133132]|uniref:molybdopterin-dependent oxidoreductase n=1 Tax=Luteipulveratus flavus TaxID=3031728 RepID=UPI0023AF857F|nr:molybdopterin-dependent oxidoreductase [Luteipulveratus sp. YIM 133132]MDE9366314.1 molybdopterin-dependent oxidoreductase [Luteipulveratus sp. YIM 133132]
MTEQQNAGVARRGVLLIGALGGMVVGAVTLAVAELIAGVLQRGGWAGGEPSPVLAVGGAFVDRTPLWLKNFAVETFGTYDKLALFVGMGLVLALLCCLTGMIALRRLQVALLLTVVLVGVAAAAVATRPGSHALDLLPILLGGVCGLLVLRGWFGRIGRPASEGNAVDRRTAVGIGAGALVATALLGWGGRALGSAGRAVDEARRKVAIPRVRRPVAVPAGASIEVAGVTPFVVPQRDFYRIDTALVVPQVDPAGWRLRVHGMVEREVEIDWETLLSKPMQEAMVTLMCVSNEVGGNLNGNAIWTGWPVRELLAQARPKPGADMVLSRSVDGFTAGTPLEALTDDRNALLAIGMNREPLAPKHGFPVRLVVPGLYGYVSATKWVVDLKVTTFAQDEGYWTPRGWSARGPVKTSSRIDVPSDNDTVQRGSGGTVALAGVAWAQHRGVTGVQVRIDDGEWTDARLGTDATVDAWRQWVYAWPASPGKHTIAVRARDSTGEWQTGETAPPDPDGSTGWHTIGVTVT